MISTMTVKDIERAITQLPRSEVAELAAWFEKFEARIYQERERGSEAEALAAEFKGWESASDEDMVNFEGNLAEIA